MSGRLGGIGLLVLTVVGVLLITGYIGLPGDRTQDIRNDTCSHGNQAACKRVCAELEEISTLVCRKGVVRGGGNGGNGQNNPSGLPGPPGGGSPGIDQTIKDVCNTVGSQGVNPPVLCPRSRRR